MMSRRRCAACKYLRRKCHQNCIFSPYFPSNDPQRFVCVHKIYGAKNVAKLLQELPVEQRVQAADSMYIEAQHRIEDPVYGCVKIISQLHQEIQNVENQLATTRAEIAIVSSNMNSNSNNNNDDDIFNVHEDHQQQQLFESNGHSIYSDLNHLSFQQQHISDNHFMQSLSRPSN